jgi:hypothetical protein
MRRLRKLRETSVISPDLLVDIVDLTAWNTLILEKLTVAWFVKIFPAFRISRKFFIVFMVKFFWAPS